MTTEHQNDIDKIMAWSQIDKRPVLLHVSEYDETLVAWNGVLMNQLVAMNVAIEQFGKYPTPKMKDEMFIRYKQLYMTGFFGEQNWDSFFNDKPDNFFMYIRKVNKDHLFKQCKDTKISEVLGWFRSV